MRICYLADAPSVLVRRWLTYAVARGHEVHVLTLTPSSEPLAGVTQHVIAARWARLPRTARYLLGVAEVRAALARIAPDLVHAHYAWGHGIWAALGGRGPVVVSLWGSDVMVSAPSSVASRRMMSFILSRADRICATGPALARAGAAYTDRPITITPFGVDIELFHPAPNAPSAAAPDETGPLRLGMVKRLDDNSGAGVLLDALALTTRSGVATVTEFVGLVADARWPQRAAELGLTERVTFTGALPAEQVAEHLRSWEVAVQPSRHTEGFGVSVLEASASGLPVIASRLGGLPDVVDDEVTGVLVPPDDATALAAAITALAADPARRERLGRAGRDRVVADYSTSQAEAIMDRVYAEVTGAGAAPARLVPERVGVVCVLYGSPALPELVAELARVGAHVVVVDNSGDLAEFVADDAACGPLPKIVRPGRNLGYSAGINAAVAALPPSLDAVLLVNPDIAGPPSALLELASAVAARPDPTIASAAGGAGQFGPLPRAPFWLVLWHYTARSSWHPRPRTQGDTFLSGALLALNAAAVTALSDRGRLLDPTLFFMDDVELSDRAAARGVTTLEVPLGASLAHEGGTSMRRRPAVRIYFSRVSKVRYWRRRSPWRGAVLRRFFAAEAALGERLAARSGTEEGGAADGFRWARRWLRTLDSGIDELALGNRPDTAPR